MENHVIPAHAGTPLRLDQVPWRAGLKVAVLGPHPDDFDCIAVTLRHLHQSGARIRLAVLSGGASGVEDADADPPTRAHKESLRCDEQRESIRRFGLAPDAVQFLPLEEDADGEPACTTSNIQQVADHFADRPDLVFLPHGQDAKGGHRNVYALYCALVKDHGWAGVSLLNRDPKTLRIRIDACSPYGKVDAAWKADLLRCHATQQQRNLRSRGTGFDERILGMDRESAGLLSCGMPYSEVFEVEDHGPAVTPISNGTAGQPAWLNRFTGGSGNGVHA